MKKNHIIKPVFIIGSGRSGTTLFYEMLAYHKDFAWISNYSNRYYVQFPPAAGISRLYRCSVLQVLLQKKIPKPLEGYRLWDWCHPVSNSPNDPPLFENDVNSESSKRTRRLVHDHIKYSGAKRFLNKNTRHCRRLRYLSTIFPDAKFIHIIRDGRAVVASLINVSFWKSLKPWILKNNIKWAKDKTYLDEIEIAAELWKAEISQVYKDREKIPPEQFHEIKYENFTASPISVLKAALEFCELDWDKKVEICTRAKNIVNMNDRFKSRLNQNQVRQVESIIGGFVKNIGYNLNI